MGRTGQSGALKGRDGRDSSWLACWHLRDCSTSSVIAKRSSGSLQVHAGQPDPGGAHMQHVTGKLQDVRNAYR